MRLFLLLLSIVLSSSGWASDLPGCVEIRSDYVDDQNPAAVAQQRLGSGCLFRMPPADPFSNSPGRLFLWTTSHVSQGSHLVIGPEGAPIATEATIIGRRADNANDLELIELDPKISVPPLGVWDPKLGRALVLIQAANEWTGGKSTHDRPLTGDHYINAEISNVGAFILKAPWVTQSPSAFDIRKEAIFGDLSSVGDDPILQRDMLARVPATGQIWIPASISPRMSGMPAVEPELCEPDSICLVVKGLGSEYYLKGLEGGYLSSDLQMSQLMSDYLANPSQAQANSTRWHFSGGSCGYYYRDYGNGLVEVASPTQNAGGGGTGNGGGGGTGNGGGGGTGNGGGGGTGNGGGGGTGNGGGGGACSGETSPQIPGILVNGQTAIAVQIGNLQPFVADEGLIHLLLGNPQFQRTGKIISPQDDLAKWLEAKALHQEAILLDQQPENLLKRFDPRGYVLQSGTQSVRLGNGAQQIFIKNGTMQFHLSIPQGRGSVETVDFTLDRHGALVGSGKGGFRQVISVIGSEGNTYSFDLTRVFFTALSEIHADHETEIATDPLKAPPPVSLGSLVSHDQQDPPILLFRELKTGVTFHLSFSDFLDASAFVGPQVPDGAVPCPVPGTGLEEVTQQAQALSALAAQADESRP